MSSRFSGSDLGTNIKAAVIAWVVAMVCSLLLGALLFALAALMSGSGWLPSLLLFLGFAGSLAILFLAGLVCSRFSAGRSAVWILIILLLLPRVLQGEWGNPWLSFGGPELSMSGLSSLSRVIGITFAAIVTWLVGILPVVAGAGFGERRRRASR